MRKGFLIYEEMPGGERVGVNILEDARHWIGLLQYNPSTLACYTQPDPSESISHFSGGSQ
jgi:hypothetical protein